MGFALWRGTDGETYVTFPSRAFGVGDERRFFDYLRGDAAVVKRFKAFVLDAYRTFREQGGVLSAPTPPEAADDTAGSGTAKRTSRKRMN